MDEEEKRIKALEKNMDKNIKESEEKRKEIKEFQKELDKESENSEKVHKQIENIKKKDNKELSEINKKFDKNSEQKIFEFFKQEKAQKYFMIALLIAIIIFGSWIRIQNLHLLEDNTTGKKIPLALDPYYFLRMAETINLQGELPESDPLREPFDVGWSKEILADTIVLMYKISNAFDSSITLRYIAVISPVIFFAIALAIFFLLILSLTNSKLTAFASIFLLAIVPSYLYRTLAGFSDHESIGMMSFFLALLIYSFSFNLITKNLFNKKIINKAILLGVLSGFASALSISSWTGVSKFVFMIVPLSALIFWLSKTSESSKEKSRYLWNFIIFYAIWFFSSMSFGVFFGYELNGLIQLFALSSNGILSLFVLSFMIADNLLILNKNKIKNSLINDYRLFSSSLIVIISGLIFLTLIGKDVIGILINIIERFLDPFGTNRVSLTVAENKQPFLNDWISQVGKSVFALFIAGMSFVGMNMSKTIKRNQNKILFLIGWFVFIFGTIFSRITPDSLLNGENIISAIVYLGSLLFFAGVLIKIYFEKDLNLKTNSIFIFAWLFFMLIAGRGAARLFFVITPFMVFMAGYSLINFYKYAKNSKEELSKILFSILAIVSLIALLISSSGFISSSLYQAKYTGPSANTQWQKAMEYVRENTNENGTFVHWWDYGYWVQYLGERATLADGGHFEGAFRDHLIGRYVLTTPNPATALSFMQTNNATYLLIDPTDIGKYTAYSSIGSSPEWDRVSSIPVFNSNSKNIIETANYTTIVYQGAAGVEDDIIYNQDNNEIFLPGATYDKFGNPNYKSYLGAILIKNSNLNKSFEQPEAIFVYNGEQIKLSLRYLYVNKQLIDFEKGVNATAYLFPKISSQSTGANIETIGSLMYLSPRTTYSTVAQLYLMNDPLNKYENLEIIHQEQDPVIKSLNSQAGNIGEFVNYKGLRGPIKIWKLNYSEEIIEHEEFLRRSGKYAEFDDLEFEK